MAVKWVQAAICHRPRPIIAEIYKHMLQIGNTNTGVFVSHIICVNNEIFS